MDWRMSRTLVYGTVIAIATCSLGALCVALLLPPVGARTFAYSVQEALRHRQSVRNVALTHKGLTEVPEELRQCPNLERIDLGGNKIAHLPIWLVHDRRIIEISLADNHLAIFLPELAEMTNIRDLNLSCNSIARLPTNIKQLRMLERLYLDRNHIKTLPPEIGGLASLETLTLTNNLLSEIPDGVANLSRLRHLDLQGNPLSAGTEKDLQMKLPNTNIHIH
jgi:Leucine-rich repeat (LRR) protein